MKPLPNIFIVGAFGVGKSTIGRELARLLHRDFYDTDQELEKILGVDIGWLFDLEGKEKFLQRELFLLKQLVEKPNIILSTGGTTVLLPESRKLLAEHGYVIGISATIEQQLQRIKNRYNKRPFIDRDATSSEIELRNFCQRYDSLYQTIAMTTFNSNCKSPHTTTQEIFNYLDHL